MSITRHLLTLVDRWGIIFRPCYALGIVNVEANALSCDRQEVAWCVLPEVARQLFQVIAVMEVDLFAAVDNTVDPRFFSIHRSDLEAINLDASHHPWHFQLMYSFPPPHLILQTLAKFATSPRVLMLITPGWQDAS